MTTRHHVDPRVANPTVVPQFPRPFDGNKTAPPQVLAINPLLTIGTPRAPTPDEIIDVDALPPARTRVKAKVKCECGVMVPRSSLEEHRRTTNHLAAIVNQRLAAANAKGQKQKNKAGRTNAQARATGSGKANGHGQSPASLFLQQYAPPCDPAYLEAIDPDFEAHRHYYPDAWLRKP